MDVNIQEVVSRMVVADARALLTPEVMEQLVAEVLRALREQEALQSARRQDMHIDRRAAQLD